MTGSARIRNVVFSAATMLSLGFGAAQAFAAPGAAAETAQYCSGTDYNLCISRCKSQGYMSGICEMYNGYPLCECIGPIQPGE